jgi:hypothetical protein
VFLSALEDFCATLEDKDLTLGHDDDHKLRRLVVGKADGVNEIRRDLVADAVAELVELLLSRRLRNDDSLLFFSAVGLPEANNVVDRPRDHVVLGRDIE